MTSISHKNNLQSKLQTRRKGHSVFGARHFAFIGSRGTIMAISNTDIQELIIRPWPVLGYIDEISKNLDSEPR